MENKLENCWLALEISFELHQQELIEAILFDFGCLGLEELSDTSQAQKVKAYFPMQNLESLQLSLGKAFESLYERDIIDRIPQIILKKIQDENWIQNWKKHFKPQIITDNLIVLPEWDYYNGNRIPIRINPGSAFGTGTHATTQLCLQILDSIALKGRSVLDYGCGSGILSIFAVMKHASFVLGIDNDPVVTDNITQTKELNLKERVQINFVIGDTSCLGDCQFFDIIICNMLSQKLLPIFPHLLKLLSIEKESCCIISGYLIEEEKDIFEFFEGMNLKIDKKFQKEEWGGCYIKRGEI